MLIEAPVLQWFFKLRQERHVTVMDCAGTVVLGRHRIHAAPNGAWLISRERLCYNYGAPDGACTIAFNKAKP